MLLVTAILWGTMLGSPQEPTTTPPVVPSTPAAAPVAPPETPAATAPDGDILPPPFATGRVDFGLQGRESDTRSSRFLEYRELPNGPLAHSLRLAGRRERFLYDVSAQNLFRDDARYRVLLRPHGFRLEAAYARIPHRFGNDARSLLGDTGLGHLQMSDTLQRTFQSALEEQFARNRTGVNFAFLSGLVGPSLRAEAPFDLRLLREQGRLSLDLSPGPDDLAVRLTYFQDHRRGNRALGTSFGFSNVVETAEPVDWRIQDLALAAEWTRSWGLLRGAVRLNWFDNPVREQLFDNPFRAVDATDPSAYQAPGSGSINGPVFGRLALFPSNQSMTGTVGFVWKIRKDTRLTMDASYGRWGQDEEFIPYSTNTAMIAPVVATDPAALPARSLDGRIDVTSLSAVFNARPVDALGITARVRRYDLSNETPRISFPSGYARFDAAWSATPRISVPYSHTNDQASATATWGFGQVDVEAGYRMDRWHRTFRETEETTQDTASLAAHWRPTGWAVVRGTLEAGRRDFEGYHAAEAEHASFLEPGAATNLPTLRRYDQAVKDVRRAFVQAQVTPFDTATLSLSYLRGKDDYDESEHGLLESMNGAFTAEVDWSPAERVSTWAFFTREDIEGFQRGRQSGATSSVNPADDWTSRITNDVTSLGVGTTWRAVKDRVEITLRGSWQSVDGHNDLESPPGGTPDVAFDVSDFDDTRLLTVGGEALYRASKRWQAAVGAWMEDYDLDDSNGEDLPNYTPGSFFLAPN
ncbi:MAG TPA: MtrB/PioB family outer membrane beta-barrel protein, partial [Vicinamibacteria bacterium]|nr:MtrB/PioB family outer membrane beta-barrel protein [Vicinamibacteria bacterium]